MARKQIKVSRRMLFTWCILSGLIFLLAPQNVTNRFQLAFARIFRLPLSIGRSISLSARIAYPPAEPVSQRDYDRLQNYLANVEKELNQKQNKLNKLSGYERLYSLEGAKLMMADVITAFIDALKAELVINRGEIDGLAVGQFVLGDNSVIGTISELTSRTGRVRLFTDPKAKTEINIGKLKIDRLMEGTGRNCAKVPLTSIEHKVKVGDIVYARKKPGLLDSSMIIGKVSECKEDDENPTIWDITVKPVCNIENIKDVAVIIMNPPK
ncbi:MAG: rod shape-determining protein MreC [Planctomycetota bacterium]|jgi:rod shape-determining protein MreC